MSVFLTECTRYILVFVLQAKCYFADIRIRSHKQHLRF